MSKVYLAKDYKVKGRVFGVDFTQDVYFWDDSSFEENIDTLAYHYSEGNFSCDCNKASFAGIEDEEGFYPCGDNEPYVELNLCFKDSTIVDLLEHPRFKD